MPPPGSSREKSPSIKKAGKKPGGGTAVGGGIKFQAAVLAIAGAHLLRRSKLDWLPIDDTPVAVWAESEGPGDDVRLECNPAFKVEIQTKKGLKRGRPLWSALEAQVKAVIAGNLDYGLLAVAPDSSGSVREHLSRDIKRLGQGREDHLTDIGKELHRRVKALGGDWVRACQRVRIRIMHAISADDADIRAAKEILRSICVDEGQVDVAWNTLHSELWRLSKRVADGPHTILSRYCAGMGSRFEMSVPLPFRQRPAKRNRS